MKQCNPLKVIPGYERLLLICEYSNDIKRFPPKVIRKAAAPQKWFETLLYGYSDDKGYEVVLHENIEDTHGREDSALKPEPNR